MSNIALLCETKEISLIPFIEAVEAFVNDVARQPPTVELYQATAKRLLGEQLTHDEIMTGVPMCAPRDLIVLEDKGTLWVSTDTQIKGWLMRMKIGRKGLENIYKHYQKMKQDYPHHNDAHIMAKVAQLFGLPSREFQIMFTKFMTKNGLQEELYKLAEDAFQEEAPVNTQSSTMPDRSASDGKPKSGDVKKRKKFIDFKQQQK